MELLHSIAAIHPFTLLGLIQDWWSVLADIKQQLHHVLLGGIAFDFHYLPILPEVSVS